MAAKAETADARRRLEARIRYEESRRAVTAAEEAVEVDQADLVAQRALRDAVEVFRREARFEELRAVWSLGDARDLVRQGYSVEFTVERTGWPARMLEDVKIDRW